MPHPYAVFRRRFKESLSHFASEMNRHPFASVGSVSEESELEAERPSRLASTSAKRARAKSVPPKPRPNTEVSQGVSYRGKQVELETGPQSAAPIARRSDHRVCVEDSAFTLSLEGQETNASQPVYGRGASVEGSISFANPSNIIKAEVKVSGRRFPWAHMPTNYL